MDGLGAEVPVLIGEEEEVGGTKEDGGEERAVALAAVAVAMALAVGLADPGEGKPGTTILFRLGGSDSEGTWRAFSNL